MGQHSDGFASSGEGGRQDRSRDGRKGPEVKPCMQFASIDSIPERCLPWSELWRCLGVSCGERNVLDQGKGGDCRSCHKTTADVE
jgi:hypothetical protein